jgi:signal transduction histidine kinase
LRVILVTSFSGYGDWNKEDNYKKIFSSFVQEDNSAVEEFGGTGLGL